LKDTVTQHKIAEAAEVSHETIANIVRDLKKLNEPAIYLRPENGTRQDYFNGGSLALICSEKGPYGSCACGKCDHWNCKECVECKCCWK
jgi:hypothetical protein